MTARSRSPRARAQPKSAEGAGAADDVATAQALREAYSPPAQSLFRVAAVLRFRRADGSVGTIEAVNAEPHDANIRGAICAERAGLCRFQREEGPGAEITRVVCVTDSPKPIFPGPLCREFLTSTCPPDTEVVAAGSADPFSFVARPLRDLLPLPSAYTRLDVNGVKALAETLGAKVRPPADPKQAETYEAALARAKKQTSQQTVFHVTFAAAVRFADGRLHSAAELKALEYGNTVDAVSLLLPEMLRVKEEGDPAPVFVMQVDQYGVAHAPFCTARTLLVEHGFGEVLCAAHDASGEWAAPIPAQQALPFAFSDWSGGAE